MQSLVVYGGLGALWSRAHAGRPFVTIDGVPLACGTETAAPPTFDAAGADRERVLVRMRAMSCNYRDRAIIAALGSVAPHRYCSFGSEFVAEVLAVGTAVTRLRPGERVIPDLHFDGTAERAPGVPGGVPTNRASRGVHVLHHLQLQPVPASMDDAEAAAFALNAQTAYSMVRRAALRPGGAALVASASANVSLAVLSALQGRGVRVYATTTSPASARRLAELGLPDLAGVAIVGRNRGGFDTDEALAALSERAGGFDHVFDPFYDLHLARVVGLMNPFGVYVSCGHASQTPHAAAANGTGEGVSMHDVMLQVMVKNLSLVGNCIGLSGDLEDALRDRAAGRLAPVVVDSVFDGGGTAAFLERSFNDPARFGKVVYRFA